MGPSWTPKGSQAKSQARCGCTGNLKETGPRRLVVEQLSMMKVYSMYLMYRWIVVCIHIYREREHVINITCPPFIWSCFSPPARWGLLDFIRVVVLLFLAILLLLLASPPPRLFLQFLLDHVCINFHLNFRLANSLPSSSPTSQLSAHRWTSTWELPSSVCTAGPQPGTFPAQCAPLDLNLGPSQLSVHRWTSTARPQRPDRMPEDMPDRVLEDTPDRMPEDIPDRMSEDMPHRLAQAKTPGGIREWSGRPASNVTDKKSVRREWLVSMWVECQKICQY